ICFMLGILMINVDVFASSKVASIKEELGKEGKIQKMDVSKSVVFIEGISGKRSGGKEFNVPIQASNVRIVELNLKDERRINALKKIKKTVKKAEKPAKIKEEKPKSEAKEIKMSLNK
ncbi:MAG: 50S ribosomal protein L24, partial [Nanoarchaeota archaeon]|nr:50S ribosomal protein L24 [Nanoarchaeota archaeon]